MYRYLLAIFVVQFGVCIAHPVTHQGHELLNITAAAQFAAEKLGKHLIRGNGVLNQQTEFTYMYHLNLKLHSPISDLTDWVTVALSFTEDGYSLEGVSGPVPLPWHDYKAGNCSDSFDVMDNVAQYVAKRLDSELVDRWAGWISCLLSGINSMEQQIQLRSLSSNRTAWFWAVSQLTLNGDEVIDLAIENLQLFRWPNDEPPMAKPKYLEF